MTLSPGKKIADFLVRDLGEKKFMIEAVILADGTQVLAELVSPEQWEAAGMKLGDVQKMNRQQRRAKKQDMH